MARIFSFAKEEKTIDVNAVNSLRDDIAAQGIEVGRYLLQSPTVYVHFWKKSDTETNKYDIYIGESNDVITRTKQHYLESLNTSSWQNSFAKENVKRSVVIIGHEHFNKSMTLDIENRLIQYALGMSTIDQVCNSRGNPQGKYYPDNELDEVFSKVWKRLRKIDKNCFLPEYEIKDSALFKASPFHKLTEEQIHLQSLILEKIAKVLKQPMNSTAKGQLIFVEGEAGTGKTVLTNSTFYKLLESEECKEAKCVLLVNHEEQVNVYREIARKLQVSDYENVVSRPTAFINRTSPDNKVDVAFVDEAHLLWTQGKMSYRGQNQLLDIMDRAKVTVIMFDENQILNTEEYWEPDEIAEIKKAAKQDGNYLHIVNQLRMNCGQTVIDWIDAITKKFTIIPIFSNEKGYDLRIVDSPFELEKLIKEKANEDENKLSRMIASYDWEYSNSEKPENKDYWEVSITHNKQIFHKPWNRELLKKALSDLNRSHKKAYQALSWAEQKHTVDEIGSTFTIQGFDLVYSGVIIGPSVKYRNGKIVFEGNESKNTKAIQNRTLSDGSKKQFVEYLLSHELRVLLTRGVKGMYIYACDDELRKALKDSIKF